jgi:hypothetical protein
MTAIMAASKLEREFDLLARGTLGHLDRTGEHLAQSVEHVVARFAAVPSRADRPGDGWDGRGGPTLLVALVDDGKAERV